MARLWYMQLSTLDFFFPFFTGTIYTFLNTVFGVQNNFLDATLGPRQSFTITLRWTKNLLLALISFIMLWIILSPKEALKVLSEVNFDSFKKFVINEKLPTELVRQFTTDWIFGVIGFTIYWMIARSMNNASINPAILFLRAYGLQDPEGNSRNLPANEISILQGYYDMLKRVESP